MPIDITLAQEQWSRYVYMRDTGHDAFVRKAHTCDEFIVGNQWERPDLAKLKAEGRPALTINTVLVTAASIQGEEVQNQAQISFRARSGAPPKNAEILSKLWQYISDTNQLGWKRSEVFGDGIITSRGFYDVRLDFERNKAGEIAIEVLNPKNVLLDPAASRYDPREWNDVIVTRWMTLDDIKVLYSERDAEILKGRNTSVWHFGQDSIDQRMRDSFASGVREGYIDHDKAMASTARTLRVLDRQFREVTKAKFLVDPKTGDKAQIPDDWNRERIAHFVSRTKFTVSEELAKRIRWRVTCEDVVLHDEWSPYRSLTVVPFFPFLRNGRTTGYVEQLIDPQLLLNKTTSQELHIVNTSANSGWIVKSGNVQNMTRDELEERGAQTGLVIEVADVEQITKITPNPVPTGIDRLSQKAETYISKISGRGDSAKGLDRSDVAAKATEAHRAAATVPLLPALSNLERTDYILARTCLELIHDFYTDERTYTITKHQLTGETDEFRINWFNPETGEIENDLSRGTYDITVASAPARRTLEESQFEQVMGLREIGVAVPDEFLIANSNLVEKGKLVEALKAQAESPQAQLQAQLQQALQQLEVAKGEAETARMQADAALKEARAQKEGVQAAQMASGEDKAGDLQFKAAEHQLKREEHADEMQMRREEHQFDMAKQADEHVQDSRLKEDQARVQQATQLITARAQARNQDQPSPQTKEPSNGRK